jgi:short-subunit dehydrogenase
MKLGLKNKVLIVTGAGSGIGRELSIQLTELGAFVAGVDINTDALKETALLISDQKSFKSYTLDISNAQEVQELPQKVKKDFKRLDGVINNAGIIQPFVSFMELTEEQIKRVMDINFYGVLNLTRSTIQYLPKDSDTYVVNVSSMGGFLPVPGQGIYGASKAAVKLFTEALYAELSGTKTHVSVVFPGAIGTNISENSDKINNIKPRKVDPEASSHKVTSASDAAKVIIKGIQKGKLRIFIGSDSKTMDKFYRLMPVKAINLMVKMINKMMEKS